MEVLESQNSDCVRISVQLYFRHSNSLSCCIAANIIPGTILLPAGLLITGWAAQKRVFWLVPDVVSDLSRILGGGVKQCLQGLTLVGAGVTTIFQNIQTYVIDSFTLHAASGEVPVGQSLAYMLTSFSSSQPLLPLLSCARWLALGFRCSLRRCTTL